MKRSDIEKYMSERKPVEALRPVCRRLAAEGTVLLKNEGVLPFSAGECVAVFGRTAIDYLASGTGSGGCVHPAYKTSVMDGLLRQRAVGVDRKLYGIYKKWIGEHPFDGGHGWATEPWHQLEFVPDEKIVRESAKRADGALIVLGRWAGEDKDNSAVPGSWYLADDERALISLVTKHFDRVAVALNTGNIIDMSWVEEFGVGAVLYIYQGGQEGGLAAADVICGRVSPSGKLTDTIAQNITDYPSDKNFGGDSMNFYEEDIYVGYRYFETFAPERVLYPFGFGLSYTSFEMDFSDAHTANGRIILTATVTNTGERRGREVAEVYFEAPQGKLGKPSRQLAAYAKTRTLAPGETQKLKISFPVRSMASYDDSGVTGHKSSYVLEVGDYVIYAGGDVRSAKAVYTHTVRQLTVTERCTEALAPSREFYRIRPMTSDDGYKVGYERVPMRTHDIAARAESMRPENIPYTGDRGIKLADVKAGRNTMEEFIGQITDAGLCSLLRAEGIASPKVNVWTTAIFGGINPELSGLGIPLSTNADGPSGIRSDVVETMTLLPGGAILASSFDDVTVERMYTLVGAELAAHELDALLAPGMNLHRHPCCGRNFEYFSEDPLLTGKMAAAVCRGLAVSGAAATPKHFFANDQEHRRNDCESVLSERCAREIHLKGFEIAVKEGGARSIMTSYNPANDCHCASSYDLTTTILRGEWGFEGFVMTDWWAKGNRIGHKGDQKNRAEMVRAQNDVYMVTSDAEHADDNMMASLTAGTLTRGELCRSAKNVLTFILKTPTFERSYPNEK